jgi:hypothetical protein
MKKLQVIGFILAIGITSLAHAQATRTWVSGVGDDVNPCSRTAPCKTFAGAISKTAPGGIINVLDPGGFGAVTINKSLTIDGSPFMAGVLASGTNGIVINATSSDKVNLRGLDIEGVSGAVNGVSISTAAVVTIENCQIYGFTRGVSTSNTVALKINIFNTTIRNNSSHGVGVFPSAATKVNIDNSRIVNNGGNGVELGTLTEGYITRSNISHNTVAGVATDQSTSFAAIESSTLAANAHGVFSGTAGASSILLSRCLITKNTSNGIAKSGDGSGALGTVTGFQNNVVNANTGDNTVTSSLAQQ